MTRETEAGVRGNTTKSASLRSRSSRRPFARGLSQQVPHANFTDDEVDDMLNNAQSDENNEKTWSRRLVENYLCKKKWYFPRLDKSDAPDLKKGWAYYEHVTLARYYVGETTDHVLRRAEPGEEKKETALYSPWKTPQSALIEWGIGVGLYFTTVSALCIMFLMAALINLADMFYYNGEEYNVGEEKDTNIRLQGSMICTTTEWVVCHDCCDDDHRRSQGIEIDERIVKLENEGLCLVKRNICEGAQLHQGIVNLVTFFFCAGFITLLSRYLSKREVVLDEGKLTATDYSVEVKNPPPEAFDPDQWRDFFSQFAEKQVTCVTIALNNQELLKKLILRRNYLNQLRLVLPKGTDLNNEDVVRVEAEKIIDEQSKEDKTCIDKLFECAVLPILHKVGMFLPPDALADKVFDLKEEIEEMHKDEYCVSRVFVTFETEEGQRTALDAMKVSKINALMNNTGSVPQSALFQGKIMVVREPTEPSAVRWLDLGASESKSFALQFVNLVITMGLISFAGWIVAQVIKIDTFLAALFITGFNSVIPEALKVLMVLETHPTEGRYQTSLYLKITLSRWIITAILYKWIVPFGHHIAEGEKDLLRAIDAMLFSELIFTPIIYLCDFVGNFKKHFLAPRARTQEQMNSLFQGTLYNLGERYTDLTKVLFLCFFYAAMFPSIFVFGFAILLVQYSVDKFMLMRIWAWQAQIGNELAVFSRRVFFYAALVAFALLSAWTFAQFPFDRLCTQSERKDSNLVSFANVEVGKKLNQKIYEDITVTNNETYFYCEQRLWDPHATSEKFQKTELKWMSDEQETLTNIYGWVAVFALSFWLFFTIGKALLEFGKTLIMGIYEFDGKDQKIDFSCNIDIVGYVPQIKIPSAPFPFLACNVDEINPQLIGWRDPNEERDHDYYNMIYDVPNSEISHKKTKKSKKNKGAHDDSDNSEFESVALDDNSRERPVFSIMKYYPPKWNEEWKKER